MSKKEGKLVKCLALRHSIQLAEIEARLKKLEERK